MNRLAPLLALCAVTISLGGCFGKLAKGLADKETYPIIEEKQLAALGETRAFTIEKEEDELTEFVLRNAGEAADVFTTSGLPISMAETLGLAITNSRQYQNEKELLYLSALSLTAARHEFSPIFSGFISGNVTRSAVQTATPGGGTDIEPIRTGTINTSLSMSKLFASGARASVGITNSFSRFFGSDPREAATGVLFAEIVQPLLRGAGPSIVLENLKQSERDVIYQVRDFARFERTFVVDRIEEYLGLLRSLDRVRNERESVRSVTAGRIQTQALGEAGRVNVFQVDQARQQELTGRQRVVTTETQFMQAADRFKLNLGLPMNLNIMPDVEDYETLVELGIEPLELSLSEGVELGLARRLDYRTVVDEVEDAQRRLHVAENGLLPDLDVSASIDIPDEGQNQPLSFDTRLRNWRVGADLELPLDRKAERNTYRRAVISLERARRDRDLLRDQIIREVRTAYQNLEEDRISYDIQIESLVVAERRVESSKMQQLAGRLDVRDVLESEVDLLDARNALTAALIDYVVARLRFMVAIEGLDVDDSGMWTEIREENDIANAQP